MRDFVHSEAILSLPTDLVVNKLAWQLWDKGTKHSRLVLFALVSESEEKSAMPI